MILTCPSCTTRYFAADDAIGANGRNVRCASCGHSWFVQGALTLEEAAPEDLLPSPAAAARKPLTRADVERMRRQSQPAAPAARLRAEAAERRRKAQARVAVIAWGGAGATLAATAAGAVALKEDVAGVWPQSASAFAAIGLPVNLVGLEFSELEVERGYHGPTPVLIVRGAVRNLAEEPRAIPPLRFSLRDGSGAEVFSWFARLDGVAAPPGGALPFETNIDNPPIQAVNLEATFATPSEALEAGILAQPPEQPPLAAPAEYGDEPLALRGSDSEPAAGEPLIAAPQPALRARPLDEISAVPAAPETGEALLLEDALRAG